MSDTFPTPSTPIVTVTKSIKCASGTTHTETTHYHTGLTPEERAVITAQEVGEAASRKAMSDLALSAINKS